MQQSRQVDIVKNKVKSLKLELDYHLLCLSDALKTGDISVQEVEKRHLERIHTSLSKLGYFPQTVK